VPTAIRRAVYSRLPGRRFVREKIYIVVLVVAIGIFHTSTIRQGHIWSDDFAMYVHHAQNIVEGRPYADTGYIYNPSIPVYGPRYYPPVYPLLLAPVYRMSGLNMIPMKLEQVFFLLLALIAVYAHWRHDLEPGYALALVALVGFNSQFWVAKDNLLSDIPFLFFFYLTALLVRGARRDGVGWWRWSAATGIAIYLSIGTRAVGISLLAGLALYDVVRLRTITRFTAASVTVCAALLILQPRVLGVGHNGYFLQPPTLHAIVRNAAAYARVLASFWVGPAPNFFRYVVLGLFGTLVLTGLMFRSERGLTFVEAALIPYLTIIILWPFPAGIRIVFPVVPLAGYLAISGLKNLVKKLGPRYSPAAASAFFILIAVCYVQSYRKVSFDTIRQTTGLPDFNLVCQAVRDQTEPQDAIIYRRARALSLYTGRPASAYNYLGDDAELWLWVENIHAKYLITTNAFDEDGGFLLRFVRSYPLNLGLVYENANFKLYHVRSLPAGLNPPVQQ
jgi:hypothetical protein